MSEVGSLSKKPVILFVGTGLGYVTYIVWSVRSLQRFGYEPIEVVVGNWRDKLLVNRKLPGVHCEAVGVPRDGYHIWMWKVFVLDRYKLKNRARDVVISDGDILWQQDPTNLFHRFAGQFWFHKLHYYDDPAELERSVSEIPRERSNWLDLSSFAHYWERYGFLKPQTYMLSGGLFMIPSTHYERLVARWASAGRGLRPEHARRNQVLLSVVANEMGLEPVWDHAAGYAVAKHYSSPDQKSLMIEDARGLGLDPDGLSRLVRAGDFVRRRSARAKALPRGLYRRVRRILGVPVHP